MPAGRPSKYNDETILKTLDYFENYKDFGDQIPSIAGLADYLEVTRTCIYEWLEDEEKGEFSYIIARILGRQEKVLANGGLTGDFTPTISKLILGKHGYSDKVEQEIGGPGGGAVPIQYVINPVKAIEPKKDEDANDNDQH